jgi:hypothetical protein
VRTLRGRECAHMNRYVTVEPCQPHSTCASSRGEFAMSLPKLFSTANGICTRVNRKPNSATGRSVRRQLAAPVGQNIAMAVEGLAPRGEPC